MLDFLDELSSNSSSDIMCEGTFDVDTDSEYDDLAAANRTSPSQSFYEDMNDKYCFSMLPTYYHTIAYKGMSILFSMLIFIGNILVLMLPYISKALRSPIFNTHADFIVINLMVVFLLSAAMVSGIVQKYATSKLKKSASQKSQSHIASIVIILYFTLYCPLQIGVIFLQFTCVDQNYLGPISFTIYMAHFALTAFNPIILCLKVPEAKKALNDRLCRCINKHNNNQM